MIQLLQYEGLGEWDNINKFSERMQAVTREDIRRVANKYFTPENRTVAHYRPKQEQPTSLAAPEEPGVDPTEGEAQ